MTDAALDDAAPSAALLTAAATHATRRVPVAHPGGTVGEVRRELLDGHYEFAGDIAVLDGERFAGLLPVERLLGRHPRSGSATSWTTIRRAWRRTPTRRSRPGRWCITESRVSPSSIATGASPGSSLRCGC